MQILGAAGKSGSGKSALITHVAKALVDQDYGLPRVVRRGDRSSNDWKEELDHAFNKAADDESKGLGDRGEIILLVDDVRFPSEVDMIHEWGGHVIFVCADHRLEDLRARHRQVPSENMANSYTSGRSSELFDFVITNNLSEEIFEAEIEKFMHMFLGGDAKYEAGLF